MQISGTFGGDRFFHFIKQIFEIAGASGGYVRHIMSYDNSRHILLPAKLTDAHLARWRSGSRRTEGRRRRPLDTGIHIGFIVKANIEEIVTPLHCTGQGLKPYVRGTAVASHSPATRWHR